MKARSLLLLVTACAVPAALYFFLSGGRTYEARPKPKTKSDAMEALQFLTASAAFPRGAATMVFDLVIPGNIRSLYAFTHGNGAFKRDLINTGIKDGQLSSALQLFPNSANEYAFISFASEGSSPIEVNIFDLKGQLVKKEQQNVKQGANSIRLSTVELGEGAYLESVKQENRSYSKKLVITR